jgi:hypothetical protein
MSQALLPGVSIPSSTIWKDWATKLRQESTARRKLARRIFENGFSFSQNWPTPRATDGLKGSPNQRGSKGDLMLPSAVQSWGTPTAKDHQGVYMEKGNKMRLRGQLANLVRGENWATPTTVQNGPDYARSARKGSGTDDLVTQIAKWGTPTARDWKGGKSRPGQLKNHLLENIHGQPDAEKNKTHGKSPGSLNPEWVEQLMGWAPGMSNFSASETEWFRWLALWRSWLFGKN